MATYLSNPKAFSTSRSRQDRLREFEQERQSHSKQNEQRPRVYASISPRGSSTPTKRSSSNARSTSFLSQDRYQDANTENSRHDTGYTSAGEPGTGRGRTRVTRDRKHVFSTGPLANTNPRSSILGTYSYFRVPLNPFSSGPALRKDHSTSTTGLRNSALGRVWKGNAVREASRDRYEDGGQDGYRSGQGVEDELSEPQEKNRRSRTTRSRLSEDRNPSPPEKLQTNVGTDSSEALAREGDGRESQYEENQKTLLLDLEKERTRCAQLESDYYALLRDYETIKDRHDREVQIMEEQGTSESRNLQKAMVEKAEESSALNRRLRSTLKKHSAEENRWAERMETVQTEMERIQKLVQESEDHTKTLKERLAARETELKETSQAFREKEAQLLVEKEAGTRLAGQVIQLEHYISKRDQDIQQLREKVESRNAQVDALAPFKTLAEDRGQELGRLQKRERQLCSGLEEILSRERAAREELEQCAFRERKLAHDRDTLTARETAHVSELEHLRVSESKLSSDLKESSARLVAASEDISKLQSEQRRLTRDLQSAHHDLKSLRASFSDARQKLSGSEEARKSLELRLENLSKDYTRSESQFRHLTEELTTARATITELNSDLSKARYEVEEVRRKLADTGLVHNEKVSQVQKRVTTLAQNLKEVEEELESARSTERQLKDSIHQKEEERDGMAKKLSDVNVALKREKDARSNDKQRKKEELQAIQEKVVAARSTLDSELESLRRALTAKTTELSTQTNLLSNLRSEFSQTLQSRDAQLQSKESQASQYQRLLTQKDQEMQLMGGKLQKAGEQVRQLEKELRMHRNANSSNGKRWTNQNHHIISRPVSMYDAPDNHTFVTREQDAEENCAASPSSPPPPTFSANPFTNPSQPSTPPGASTHAVPQPPPNENEFRASYVARPDSPAGFDYQTSRQSLDLGTTAKFDPRAENRSTSRITFGNPFSDKTGEDDVDHEGKRDRMPSELPGTASHRGSHQGGIAI